MGVVLHQKHPVAGDGGRPGWGPGLQHAFQALSGGWVRHPDAQPAHRVRAREAHPNHLTGEGNRLEQAGKGHGEEDGLARCQLLAGLDEEAPAREVLGRVEGRCSVLEVDPQDEWDANVSAFVFLVHQLDAIR
jgi:hypothetical protein